MIYRTTSLASAKGSDLLTSNPIGALQTEGTIDSEELEFDILQGNKAGLNKRAVCFLESSNSK